MRLFRPKGRKTTGAAEPRRWLQLTQDDAEEAERVNLYRDWVFPTLLKLADRYVVAERRYVAGQARGRVLEIGIGRGANLGYYGPQAHEVVGIEPHTRLLELARQHQRDLAAQQRLAPHCDLQPGSAEALDFPDASFDCVIACLVFCTIPDPRAAAAELFRVLKPGGELLFFEHVRAPEPALARWQGRVNPLWQRVGCGCHLDRDTKALFSEAGFEYRELREYRMDTVVKVVAPVILGRAVRPG